MRHFASLLLISLGACFTAGAQASGATTSIPTSPGPTSPSPTAPGPGHVHWPATLTEIPTTSADIYLGNLDARVDALDSAYQRKPRPALQVAKAGALYHRYRIRGRLQDAEQALALLDQALATAPKNAEALKLRATVRAGFHQFAAASADLDAAQALGAKPEALTESRREIALATGRYAELRDDLARSNDPNGPFYELAFRGNLRLQQGDLDGAGRMFALAQPLFADSSPMPLAWLHVQEGIALLRFHRYEDAARFFRAAHERLPGFTLATEHLAESEAKLGHRSVARKLYHEVIADTGSPEFIAALARVERADGHAKLADQLQAQAQSVWMQWLQKHPAAFAQHAIPFFIDTHQAPEALSLARENIALRQDVASYIMLARAADAAGETVQACSARKAAIDTGLRPPELADIASLQARCPERVAY